MGKDFFTKNKTFEEFTPNDDVNDGQDEQTNHDNEEAHENPFEDGDGGGNNNPGTPFLDNFGRDITQEAEDGNIDPIIGREKEIDQIIWVLSRKNKNNPVIIGEPGVGKTAIVEGIARMIVSDDCPDALEGKRIIYTDMGSIMAGASAQGDLEKRVQQLMKELDANRDIILFIDEIHMIMNPQLSIDVANMFKPALARGEMRLIGATTYNEFRESIEKDGALQRRFQKVNVEPTSVEDTLAILKHIKPSYEEFHKVSYEDEALVSCVRLSDKYITDRFFPDKAIDLLDEVGARVRISRKKNVPPEVVQLEVEIQRTRSERDVALKGEDYAGAAQARVKEKELIEELSELGKRYSNEEETSPITAEDVEKVIAIKTGIPVTRLSKDDGERLLRLESDLSLEVIGQDEAVSKVAKCIRRSRSGLKDPKRPSGVFLFLGSTGVGKTHLVKTLAKHMFTSEEDVIRVDMSEYASPHEVSKMIGSPPGYVGYGEGGQLSEKVRRKPYSIVLFDEIEKAHKDILDIMLQIFDDGHLTDGSGKKVDFKNTIIIMTSNIGTGAIEDMIAPVGFGTHKPGAAKANAESIIKKELKKAMKPEFINRIDDIIIFNGLTKENIRIIVDAEVKKLAKRMDEMNLTLEITDNVKDALVEHGYDVKYGARPLKRAIQKYLEDPISDEIIRKSVTSLVKVDYINDKIVIENEDGPVNESRLNTSFEKFKRETERSS
tara:strand:- start:23922 stop:26081 length:2160 start_codon:yes stop_codon:yes gene_type:complete